MRDNDNIWGAFSRRSCHGSCTYFRTQIIGHYQRQNVRKRSFRYCPTSSVVSTSTFECIRSLSVFKYTLSLLYKLIISKIYPEFNVMFLIIGESDEEVSRQSLRNCTYD